MLRHWLSLVLVCALPTGQILAANLTVTKIGSGIVTCGTSACPKGFVAGTSVVLTATAATAYTFSSWSDSSCPGTGTCTITMGTDPKTITATFSKNPVLTLQKFVGGNNAPSAGSVSATASGGTCTAATCSQFSLFTPVTISATPAANYVFEGWSGACTGTGACTLQLNGTATVRANFRPYPQVTVNRSLGGTVTSSPAGLSCGATTAVCRKPYAFGSLVTLTAVPRNSNQVAKFTGACSGYGSCTVTLPSIGNVSAQQISVTYVNKVNLSTTVGEGGSVEIVGVDNTHRSTCSASTTSGPCPSASLARGSKVQLSANANPGYQFRSWEGSCAEQRSSCILLMDVDKSTSASFRAQPFQVLDAWPTNVVPGDTLTVSGTFISSAVSAVTLNGTAAPFTLAGERSLMVTVPSHAQSGQIRVYVGTSSGGGPSIRIGAASPLPPLITTVAPGYVAPMDALIISGENLDKVSEVKFGNRSVIPIRKSSHELRLMVPEDAVSGPFQVVSPSGIATGEIQVGNGRLDSTFAVKGRGSVTLADGTWIRRAVVARQGQILGVGSNGKRDYPTIIGLTPMGLIDNKFPKISGSDFSAIGLYEEDNVQKIAAAGHRFSDTSLSFMVTRLGLDGRLDTSFNSGAWNVGWNTVGAAGHLPAWGDLAAKAMAVQSDGKIVVVGLHHLYTLYEPIRNTRQDFALARFNPDGTLDTTFRGGMFATSIDRFFQEESATHVAVSPRSGKIVVLGYTYAHSHKDIAIIQYDSLGNLDPSFNGNGILIIDLKPEETWQGTPTALAVQEVNGEEQILIAGNDQSGGFLLRVTPHGELDSTFGNGRGYVTPSYLRSVADLAITGNSIVVGGTTTISRTVGPGGADYTKVNPIIMRFHSNGALDSSFNGQGFQTVSSTVEHEEGTAVAVDPNGLILLFAKAWNSDNESYYTRFYRFLP